MTPRRKRMMLVLLIVLGVAAAVALTMNAFRGNLVYFYSPSQIGTVEKVHERNLRLGGLVEQGSVRLPDRPGLGLNIDFADWKKRFPYN